MSLDAGFVIPQWTVADRLRKARELTGMSQAAFALYIGVSRNVVSNSETGSTYPQRLTLRAWAEAANVPEQWLIDGAYPTDGPDGPDGLRRPGTQPTDVVYAQVRPLRPAA